jgi:hypothetical protein
MLTPVAAPSDLETRFPDPLEVEDETGQDRLSRILLGLSKRSMG